jgi:hypothetical protein
LHLLINDARRQDLRTYAIEAAVGVRDAVSVHKFSPEESQTLCEAWANGQLDAECRHKERGAEWDICQKILGQRGAREEQEARKAATAKALETAARMAAAQEVAEVTEDLANQLFRSTAKAMRLEAKPGRRQLVQQALTLLEERRGQQQQELRQRQEQLAVLHPTASRVVPSDILSGVGGRSAIFWQDMNQGGDFFKSNDAENTAAAAQQVLQDGSTVSIVSSIVVTVVRRLPPVTLKLS